MVAAGCRRQRRLPSEDQVFAVDGHLGPFGQHHSDLAHVLGEGAVAEVVLSVSARREGLGHGREADAGRYRHELCVTNTRLQQFVDADTTAEWHDCPGMARFAQGGPAMITVAPALWARPPYDLLVVPGDALGTGATNSRSSSASLGSPTGASLALVRPHTVSDVSRRPARRTWIPK